ncbi:unnamed protein product (macronuclear) [Paramecium tetraurelia]|uniref:Uncharacterized protein n=1 Tax=Paramecium tetraurelia TaxID=5888 RepID=A0CSZ1_PARTE|nr:uncharacterized protein GSPATT00010181001 [Paramecium tetraurelia]CAK73908.1 unnamed protein product [Paramecium tetraurelia]|eukprot:XP_001441305.1 hypothetical protein (macronuclear) [Paramecium tetraurelia strain d4-2]
MCFRGDCKACNFLLSIDFGNLLQSALQVVDERYMQRALLTPHPMRERRVKGQYILHDFIYASMSLKISAGGLEESMAGSQMYLANIQEDIDKVTEIINNEMEEVKIHKTIKFKEWELQRLLQVHQKLFYNI